MVHEHSLQMSELSEMSKISVMSTKSVPGEWNEMKLIKLKEKECIMQSMLQRMGKLMNDDKINAGLSKLNDDRIDEREESE